jgi:PilZ domain-containing protein
LQSLHFTRKPNVGQELVQFSLAMESKFGFGYLCATYGRSKELRTGMPMPPKGTERRKHQRLPLSIPVFVRGKDDAGKDFLEFATALNISAGGALLASRRSLPKSSSLSLEIPVAPLPTDSISAHSIRSLKAKLIRVSPGEKYHLLGLKFTRAIQS